MARSFIGTFLGKLAAAAFIAACIALGVGPDWWATMILSVQPVWYIRAGLGLLALATAGAIFGPALASWLRSPVEIKLVSDRDDVPDVRVADDPSVRHLFEGSERDKLVPLLETGKLDAWGRRGNSFPPLSRIPSDKWKTLALQYHPAPTGGIDQTFLKVRGRPYESEYYDIHLNREQLKRRWTAELETIPLLEAARIVFDKTKDSMSAQMARAEGTEEAALRWYCYALIGVKGDGVTHLMELTGTRPPSRVREPIKFDRPPPHLEILGDTVVLIDLTTKRVLANNLTVPTSSIADAVSFILGLDLVAAAIPDLILR